MRVVCGHLVRVVNAFEIPARDDLDIDFLAIDLVKKRARNCAGDAADLHHRAHAGVENTLLCGVDLGAENGRSGLPSGYLELQSAIFDSYIIGSVVLAVGCGGCGGDRVIAVS